MCDIHTYMHENSIHTYNIQTYNNSTDEKVGTSLDSNPGHSIENFEAKYRK